MGEPYKNILIPPSAVVLRTGGRGWLGMGHLGVTIHAAASTLAELRNESRNVFMSGSLAP